MKPKPSPARLWWKWYWRQLRIIRRETTKQWQDMILFGNGYARIGPDVPDLIQHIPVHEIRVMHNQ